MPNWSKISPERFEELCTEIIRSEGFYNIRRIGGSGDRGRDIVANKEYHPFPGTREIQNWVVQCKRYVSANLSIQELGAELNIVRMHKPDYYLIILSNTVNSNLHDWLAGVREQYPFRILLFDIDWLEMQMQKQQILRQHYFENVERHHSYTPVANSVDLQVYTAGKMPTENIRGAINWWRRDLEFRSATISKKIGFFHPEFAGCDHSGIQLSETVQKDFAMIAQSNLLVAYLEDSEQFGTLTEIMIAYSMNKQIALFIDESINVKFEEVEFNSDKSEVRMEYYEEVYRKIFKTNHSCPCDLMNELESIHMNNYWFMVEFLRLRQPDTFIKMTSKDRVVKDIVNYIKKYTH